MKKLLLILTVTMVMISCSATTTNKTTKATTGVEVSQSDFLGTTWKLEKYLQDGKLVEVIENSKANILFDEKIFSGNSSVNKFSGSYILEEKNLKMGPVRVTRMMGPEEANKQEVSFLGLLGIVTSYKINGDKLILLNNEDEEILIFTATPKTK